MTLARKLMMSGMRKRCISPCAARPRLMPTIRGPTPVRHEDRVTPVSLSAGVCTMRIFAQWRRCCAGSQCVPIINAYPFTSSSFWDQAQQPRNAPDRNRAIRCVCRDGASVAVGHPTSPNISAHPFSPSGLGSSIPTQHLALPRSTALHWVRCPRLSSPAHAYPWSAGFGTKYSDPGTLAAGARAWGGIFPARQCGGSRARDQPLCCSMGMVGLFGSRTPISDADRTGSNGIGSPDSGAIAVAPIRRPMSLPIRGHLASETKVATRLFPTGSNSAVAFAPNGNSIAVAHDDMPFNLCLSVVRLVSAQVLNPTSPAVQDLAWLSG